MSIACFKLYVSNKLFSALVLDLRKSIWQKSKSKGSVSVASPFPRLALGDLLKRRKQKKAGRKRTSTDGAFQFRSVTRRTAEDEKVLRSRQPRNIARDTATHARACTCTDSRPVCLPGLKPRQKSSDFFLDLFFFFFFFASSASPEQALTRIIIFLIRRKFRD